MQDEYPTPAGASPGGFGCRKGRRMRTCHICGTECQPKEFCPKCVEFFPLRRNATEMTSEERAVELESWMGVLEIPFDMLHKRIEELLGRPVWTHELARPEALLEEIRSSRPATMDEIIEKIPEDKRVVVLA